MYILESGLFIFYTIMFVTIINKVNIKCCPSLLMCPYRNTKALCCPTEYFLSDEADQNRPLISETAGVINCVFIFRGGREHGTKFSTYKDQRGRPIKRRQSRAHQGISVQKNKSRYDEVCAL